MNIVNKLTLRHMKHNKRRTLVTIIGVIISVAMITAVATLGVSFMELLKKQEIANKGLWHVKYHSVNKEQVDAIRTDETTKMVLLSQDLGFASLQESQNAGKPYLNVLAYNHTGFEHFPVKLLEGRLPQNTDELVISEQIALNAKVPLAIGDQFSLEIGERYSLSTDDPENKQLYSYNWLRRSDNTMQEELRNKTTKSYTVVGIIERPRNESPISPSYTVISYIDETLISNEETVDLSVVLKKVDRSLYEHAETLADQIHIDHASHVRYNSTLLRYYGVTNDDTLQETLYSLCAIIIGIIILGSVSLIYNAFAISVSERSRHLGMLSSVGATNRQKRNSVFFEGAIIGLIAIPIGLIAGLVGIGVTFLYVNGLIEGALEITEKLTVKITPWSILVACLVSIFTIFISTWVPALRASRISAIDAIRQAGDIKLSRKAVKTSKLVRLLFGIESEIGLKNMKRNKRRYQATVISLVISIVLFMTVSYFTDSMKKSFALTQSEINYDIQVSSYGESLDASFTQSIATLSEVTKLSQLKFIGAHTILAKSEAAESLVDRVEQHPDRYDEDIFRHYVRIFTMDEHSLTAYMEEIGLEEDSLHDPNQISAIIIDTVNYRDNESGKLVEAKALNQQVGGMLNLFRESPEEDNDVDLPDVTIAALTPQLPMGVSRPMLGELKIIVSERDFETLLEAYPEFSITDQIYLQSTHPLKTQQDIEELKGTQVSINNQYQRRQQEGQSILFISVFIYGFIILITAISVANIFNTISTSIALRKREFAMLRSVGMTPRGFNKMIHYESIFYGIKSLLYGLPISILVMILIHRTMMNSFSYKFELPWLSFTYVIISVFIIVGSAMLYATSKVKQDRIIDALKQENL